MGQYVLSMYVKLLSKIFVINAEKFWPISQSYQRILAKELIIICRAAI